MMELPDFSGVRILCVGDLMLDRFVSGEVNRVSPESPVPVVHVRDVHSVPGGAANVGRNISALGGHCTLIGVVGEDAIGRELETLLTACGRIRPVTLREEGRPTIEKVRYVAQGQQLLRVDRERVGAIASETADAIVAEVEALLADHNVLILSDYAKGVLTDSLVSRLIKLGRKARVPIVVDPKSADLGRYRGATIATPNAKEAKLATGMEVDTDVQAETAGMRALETSGIESILLTRSERGMTLITQDGMVEHMPASAREVFDVAGAGDTVVAALALGLAVKLPDPDAVRIANAAAGLAVGKRGTATVSPVELAEELARLAHGNLSDSQAKRVPLARALIRRQQWEKDGLTVGFTNGCFDILHVGHVRLLEFARSQCDRLVVGLNSDASVARLKGPNRPVNSADDRAQLLGALSFVDAVVVFEDDTPLEVIRRLEPDLLVKGADYAIEQIVGHEVVLDRGGRVVTFDLVPGRSTTNVINKARLDLEATNEIRVESC